MRKFMSLKLSILKQFIRSNLFYLSYKFQIFILILLKFSFYIDTLKIKKVCYQLSFFNFIITKLINLCKLMSYRIFFKLLKNRMCKLMLDRRNNKYSIKIMCKSMWNSIFFEFKLNTLLKFMWCWVLWVV
jgi:hypothetical protein